MDYKLIAKVFARRLNTCIYKCVEEDQFAFIKGRQIADLLREMDDIIEYGKIHFPNSIVLSLDYAKAFDTLTLSSIKKALKFFGFSDLFIKWIDVLLADRLSCVRNGGYISDLFSMERGVRQGCPISPLLFILTLELLARDIRNNGNIQGVCIAPNSPPVKIKLYADDATLFLKNLIDFREVLSRIKLFSVFSGLCLNKRKCSAMYIGGASQKGSYRYGIKFTNYLRVLGIHFSNEKPTHEISDNFEPRIISLEKICSLWEKRCLSQIGKITILKTFGISQFIYIMQSIGINSGYLERINRILFRFIWNNKVNNDKKVIEFVKRKTVCSGLEVGGLNMINIIKMQDSFLLKWADKLLDDHEALWKAIPIKWYAEVGGRPAFNSNVTGRHFKGLNLIRNLFWRRVLVTWLNFKNKDFQLSDNTIKPSDPVFNNALVQYRSNTIFLHSCIKQNMILLSDFIIGGTILSSEQFAEKFGKTAETHLAYYIVYNALKNAESKFYASGESDSNTPATITFNDVPVGSITRKGYYNMIKDNEIKPLNSAWVQKYSCEVDAVKIWSLSYECTSEVKLIILQWKILHDIYPTGTKQFKMKLSDSEDCFFCGERDTVAHFFFQCPVSQEVWREASTILSCKLDKTINIQESDVIFGFFNVNLDNSANQFLNIVGLIGKHTISKFKYEKTGKISILFERELRIRNLGLND